MIKLFRIIFSFGWYDVSMVRSQELNSNPVNKNGQFVLYVMSRDQRVADNHALLAAQKLALEQDLSLIHI